MGLAVLPARLANELAELERAIVNGEEINSGSSHYTWVKDVISKHPELNAENTRYILDQEVGEVFLKVLLDAGVFKRNAEGKAAFDRFISHIR